MGCVVLVLAFQPVVAAHLIVLARHLRAGLVTSDRRLAKAPRLGIGVIEP